MDPVTENLQIPYRRRPRKVIEVSLFGGDHCVSTENIQTSICVDEKNTIEVSRREVSELEAKARAYEHLASGHDSAVGVDVYEDGKESHLSDADWEVEKFYPSTERLLGRSIKAKSEVVPVESEVLAALEEASLIRYGHASEEHVKERSENLSVVDDSAMDRQSASGSVDESATQKSSTILTEDIVQQAAVEAKLGTDSGLDQVRTKYDDSTHSTLYDDTSNVSVSSSVEQSHPGVQLPSISGSVTDSSVAYEKSLADATAVDETRSPISKDLERQALDDDHVSDNRESVMNVCDTEGVHPSTDEQKPGGRSGIPGESYADESQTLSTNRPTGSLEEVYLAQDDKKSIDHRGLGPDASKESSDEMSFLSTPGDRINLSVSSDQEERFQRAVGTDHDKTKYGEETLFAAENIEQVTDRPFFYDEDQEADRQKGDHMGLGNQNITRDSLDLQRHLGGIESLVEYPQEKDTSVSQDQKAAQFEGSKMESFILDDQESGGHGLLAFEEQSPADRGIISGKSAKEASVTPQHQSETASGEVPPKYMQGAFFGLDDSEEAGKEDREGGKQPDKKQERKKRKKKGNLYTEEELKEGDVLQVTYTVEETLVDESHARDSASRSVGELSHDLGDHGVTEDEYFGGKTFEKGETLPQGDWKAVESGEKLTESGEGGKLFISDSWTSGEWGDMQNKSLESASTDLTEQGPVDEKAATAEYPRESVSLGYQETEQHERLPTEFSGKASLAPDDQTSTDRGIISGKSVETDSLKKGTGERGYASAEFMEGASLGFDDSRRTDRSEIEGESYLGSNIPTKHVETAVETGDGSSRLLKGPDDEGPGRGNVPARVSEEGSTDRQAIDHRDEQIKSTAFDVDDRMASDHGDHVLTKAGESYESISTESQKDKGTLHPGGDQWTSERGDVATKFIGDASFSMDDDQMATDRAVISSKSVERASLMQKDVEAKEGGNQPEGLVEGAFTVEDQGRKDWGEVPTEGEGDGRKTSERGDIPTKFTEGASIRLEDRGKGDWGKVPKVEKHWEEFPKEEEEHWGNVPKEGEHWGGVQKEGEHWGGVPKDGKHWGGVPKEGGHWGTIPREEEHWGDFPKEGEHWENVPKEGEHWGDFPKPGEPWGEVPKEGEHWRGVPKEEHWGDFSKQGEHWGGIPEEGEHWRGVPKDGEQWRGVAEEGEHWRGVPKDGGHWRGVPKDAELWRGVAEEGENWRQVPTEGIHWRDVPEAGEHWGGVPKEGGQWADVPKAGEHWGEVPKDGHDGWGEIKREEAFRIRDEQRIAEIHDRYKDTELKYEETWGMSLDRGDDKTKLIEGFDVKQDLPTDHGVSSGRLAEGASFTPADKRALDRGDDRTKLIEGFDVEQDLPTDRGVISGNVVEGASFTSADKRALDRGDDRTKLSEGFDVEQDLPTDHGVSSGRLAEGASFTPADKRALDRGEERTKLSEGFDVEQDLPTDRGVISSKVVEGASFTPADKRALDRGDDKTKRNEGVDVEQDLPTDRGISSGNVVEGSSFTPADKRALDRGDDRTKLSEGFDVEQDLPTDRGVISGKVAEGALFIAADNIASESGNVPSKFMEGAYFGLDSQKNVEGGDDQVEEGMGQKNNLEAPDGGSQSHFGKKKDRKDKKKKKKKGSQQPEEAEEETIPQIDPTKERPFPAVEPLPSLDSHSLVSESGKDDAILGTDQLQVSSVSVPAEELQEQKRQRELEEKKRLQELEEQKELERQRHLQELKDQERLQELEELKRKQELEEKRLQELEEQRRLQDLEDQKRLAELEEQKRLKDLEEQKRLKELEEQKRLEALEEQKHLEALEEQKRLEALEQKRLQNIKELQDEKKASCLPLTEQLDQLGQRLAHIRKHPSQPEKSEERMQQLEDLQKDLKELETRLLALKNEWKDVSLDEDGGDDPIFAALSNLQTLKIEARQCSDDLQGRMDERRQKQNELSKITKRFDGVHLWFMTAKAFALGKPIHTTSVKFQQEQLCDISNVSEELDSKLQELNDIVDELHSLPDCEDLKAESRLEEKLDALQNDISNLKDSLAERLKNLKKDTEKNEKRQKELQNLEASLVDIQKKVSQMLKSSELPTEDDVEIWKQMPKPGRELQQMLQSEIQEQRELVKTVADEHDTLKAAAPETRTSLPETSTWYTPLPLAVVTREPGSSKVLEAAVQKKVADLRKYWLNMPRDGSAGLDEYQSGQRKFGDVMSTAFQWLDCIEGEAARPTNAAELQDLQRQTKLFRLIYGELLELQKMTGETGRSLKDRLPVSSAQQSALLAQLLEDLDRRLALLEEEERAKELEAAERKAWQIKLQKQLADVEKEVRDDEQRYLTLSNRQIPCETQLMAAKQLDDDCKEGIQKLDGLRTEVELRFIQDTSVSIPPELFSLRHHLIDLHDKVAEKKLDLLRTTNSSVQYATLLEQYAEFLETAQDKVKVAVPSVSDLSQLKDLLSMHKEFFQDLVSHQTLVETIGQKVELHERQRYLTSHARLNNMALGVLDKANAQEMRLKQAVDQWSDVGPQLKEKIAFLESVEKRLPRPTGENDSMEALEQRIRDLQVVQRELEAEKGSIFQVVESGRQLLKLVACPALTRKLDDFVDRHKKLSDELAEELKSLEALVKLSKQFDSESDKVEQWMKAADGRKDSIKKMLLAKDVKQAEDGLLELKRDCEDYQSHRTSAITLGNKLLRTRPSDNRVRNKLKLVSDDWLALMIDIADIETRVQDAQRAQLPSRQALSELLQWLLTVQQSVAQDGSTRPRNREDVQQLLKKYKLLKGDLANRQLNIDYVNKVAEQGQGDKQGSHTDQALSAEQLGEMNKQYQGLCSEINNKTIKLEMVSDAWKEYESTVQSLRDWLDSESIQISREEKNLKGTIVDPTLKYCREASDALKIKKEKDLESVKRLGSNLVKSSDWPANAESINSNLDALNQHCTLVEDKLSNLQQLASDRKQLLDDYDLALRGVSDVVDRTQSSLNKLQQTSGCDITSLNDQIVQLQALQRDFDGSKEVLKKLSGATDALVANLDPASSKVVEDGQKKAADRWQKLKELFSEQLSTLRTLSSKWTSYNEEYNNAVIWLNKKESDIERLLQNDLREDKEGQLKDITAEQKELVAFRGKLLNLESLSKELMPSLDRARVVHIASSQTSLNQHVDSLQQLVDRRLQNFASAEDSREKLIELCQKVEAFLKEATAGLNKASSPYNSSDPEVVEDRLKLVRNLSDEFAQMSPSFTELNHTGYRLPLSKADSDRLKTINDKWQDLHSQTNKQHKKLQQQFLLLQSFADKCKEWNSFLAEVESELTGDIGGNYNSVLQQQQKLEAFQQDIFPHQQILYSIISDGHEMMENSRGTSGAEDFGRKLQLLEEQWQTIVRQANQRKALVDSIVTLWQTYREMTDELSTTVGRVRRFVDSHRVVPETFSSVRHHLDGYTDIRNQLNATKPLVDKLRSYSLLLSPNSDSTTIKQLDLDIKSLDDEAKSLSSIIDSNIKQLGHILTLWETTQSNLENFVAWLKEIKSFLNPDVPNKYNALVNELEKLENLQSDKSDRCDELTKNLEELTGFITSEDSLILCQRLRLLTQQQSEVSRQLADRRQLVRDRLNRWAEFDKKSDALLAAFANVEQKISNLDALSIEDAIAEIENDLQPEVASLERRKVELTGLGNELKRNSQDLRASDIEHKIANMNDKCSRLKEILNERLNKLAVALGTLQQLEKRIQDLRWWLLDIEHQLTRPIIYETCSNAEIQHQLKKQLVLQKDIDDHQLPVISVINLCETLSSDKIACPSSVEAQDIRQARDKLESRWKKINVASTERKKVIEETGQLWQKFNTAHQEFTVWLKTIERQVLNPKTGGATFKAMKEQRANIQKLQVDIQTKLSNLDLLNRLYCRLAHDGRTDAKKMLRKKIDDANLRWDNLLARAAAVVKHLSHMISIKEDFEANRLALVIWLSSLNDVLTELEQLDGPPNAKVLNFIRKELANNSARMEYTDRASSYLIQRCEPSDAAQVQRHVDEFHALHEGVLSKLNHLEDRLRLAGGPDAVRENEQHREKIRQLETQLEGSRKNISSSEIQDAVGRLDVNIDDEWNDGLWQATRPDWEEGVGSRITGSYMSPGDESLLVELTSLEEWLVEANATLDSEKRAPRDMAQFDRCLKKHQDLNDQIESWKPRAFRIRSALSPISHHTPFTEGLCDRISAAIVDWDRVCLRASDWFPRLQHQLVQSEEFHMSIEDLALWVEDVRVDLDSLDMEKPVDASTPPSMIEAKKKKLAMIDRDLKDIRINLNFIRDIAEYFLQDSPPDAAIEDCDQLDSIADDLEAMQVAYNNHLTMLEAVRGRSFEHSLTGGESYLSKGSVFPLGTSGRRIPRYAHLSAGKQKQRGKSPKGAADAVTHDDGSYLSLLRRACRTAIPIQLMMLLLIGVASLVPMCENECVFNSLDPLLKYADGAPPL